MMSPEAQILQFKWH